MHSPLSAGTLARFRRIRSHYALTAPEHIADLADTGQCVMCGLCTAHCPTYGVLRNEADSPRGRIALMRGLAQGDLEVDAALTTHLNRCLGCRACEAVCPSGVPFGRLMDSARALVRRENGDESVGITVEWMIDRKQRKRAASLLRGYQRSGLQKLVRRSGILGRSNLAMRESLLPELDGPSAWQEYYPPGAGGAADVALFTGCATELSEHSVLVQAIALLHRLGFGVHVPPSQACCGALHRHEGFPDKARQLAETNLDAFAGLAPAPLLYLASGCGAQLREYGAWLDQPEAEAFASRAISVQEFLLQRPWPDALKPRPLTARVAIHVPCSEMHVLRQPDTTRRLLQLIPGIELIDLPDNGQCCGAGGNNLLREPELANTLRDSRLRYLHESPPDILVTSNTGCRLHLSAGIREAGLAIEVLHPVELLARQVLPARLSPGRQAGS